MNNYKLFNELQVKLAQEIYKIYDKVVNKVAKLHKISKQIIEQNSLETLDNIDTDTQDEDGAADELQ